MSVRRTNDVSIISACQKVSQAGELYGIRSLRQTVKDAEVNVAYRWFIGYTMAQAIPHFATISYAFATRFPSKVIEQVFVANEAGYFDLGVVFMDGMHIKANANLKKHIKKEIPQTARYYEKQLMEEVNQDREAPPIVALPGPVTGSGLSLLP